MGTLFDGVFVLGALQGFALSAALAGRPTNRLANRILAALVGALSLMLLVGVLDERFGFAGHPHLIGLGMSLPFLFAPLLFLYVHALTRPAERFDRRWLLHGLPFLADLLYVLQGFYLKPAAEKLALAQAALAGHAPAGLQLFRLLLLLQALVYLGASFQALRRYARKMEGYFSDLARIDLRWLSAMVLAHAAVWSVVIASRLLETAGSAPRALHGLEQAVQVGSALVVFLTGYVSLWQPELFDKARLAQVAAEPEPERKPLPKYQRNRLEDDEAAALAGKITALMAGRKLYRDASLTLQALADQVGATPHTLSQVLNLHLGKSFFALVNSYRTEELMAALADPALDSRGVLELGLDVGFNSKSSLNTFFKRYTGLTPTQFRERRPREKIARISTG